VGINDETQLHGNVTSPPGGVYQTQPKDTQPRPISGPVANDPYARPGTGAQLDGEFLGRRYIVTVDFMFRFVFF